MLLNFDDDSPFATGMARYRYEPVPGSDDACRIHIQIEIDEQLEEAILDTGGQYLFCTPELANSVRFEPDMLQDVVIGFRGQQVTGTLCLLDIRLMRDEGESLIVPVTAFLPNPDQAGLDPEVLPYSFLGLHCCMDRIRFAIDPSQDRFYFGEHPGEHLGEQLAE